MQPDLTILCVTRGAEYGAYFRRKMSLLAQRLDVEMLFAADGCFDTLEAIERDVIVKVTSKGYIESVLDEALAACSGKYVLRLDDDEAASPAMERWLEAKWYLSKDHWSFPRFHLWPDVNHAVVTPPFFPDWQTRLSLKEKSGGRPNVHQGSPFGLGSVAPVGIEHYELLVKTQEERALLAKGYNEMGGFEKLTLEQAMKTQPESWSTPPVIKAYTDGSIKLREIRE